MLQFGDTYEEEYLAITNIVYDVHIFNPTY